MGTTGQSVTLANSIIGVGILAMPFCFQQCGILLATLILLFMGLVSRLSCYFLLKSALIARRRNFEFLAFHVFGSAGKMAVELGIIGFLMGTCIAYFVVVGDLGPQIISKMFNINQSDILRTSIMVIVSLVCVLPLGLLRNVDSLNNVSAATIGFYFCLVIKVIAEAASQLWNGDWHTQMEMWKPSGVLQCVPIFSMALFCQAQLFEIFESLPSLSLEKMNVVTKNAINICTAVYFTLGLFGYIAFCSQKISGNILMSLSPTMASDVIKLGFVMSLAFSFPLIIFPCRASLYSFLYQKVHSSHHDHIINHSIPEGAFRCITVAIIAVALFVSLLIPNIELVLGLVGSTIGVMICVMFPAACFVNVTFKNTNERVLAKAVLVLGLVIMVLGTFANLQAAEIKLDRYDDKYITQERIDKIVEDFFESRKLENSEGVIIKPLPKSEPNLEEKSDKKIIKDSEIQPPNPVPPELQSNEKEQKPKNKETKEKNKESKPEATKNAAAAADVPKTHPKDLKIKLEEVKLPNGANNANNIKETEKPKEIEKTKEREVKTASNQEKIDIMKQQQLIETIKQHGQEQKELIKEQKEIIHEIRKELQDNKKDIDSNEAKKIAVESIQKIANMAIQSLAGVSEKPDGQNNENLEKIANEAVREIAKKTVETIEALKENKDNLKPGVEMVNQQLNNNVIKSNPTQNQQVNVNNNLSNIPENKPNLNNKNDQTSPQLAENTNNLENVNVIPQNPNNIPADINNVPLKTNNILSNSNNAPENANIPSANSNNILGNKNNAPQTLAHSHIESNIVLGKENQQNNADLAMNKDHAIVSRNVNGVLIDSHKDLVANSPLNHVNQHEQSSVQVQDNQNLDNLIPKVHSHSPDEPQSYKQGEDIQEKNKLKVNKDFIHKAPLPIALNGNSQNLNEGVKKTNKETREVTNDINNAQNNNIKNNGAIKDISNNLQPNNNENKPVPIRQKREIVDCTEKTQLKAEDKEICDTLVQKPEISNINQEILLPKVDFSDMGLPKSIPLDSNIIHHIRSLKSYDETVKKR